MELSLDQLESLPIWIYDVKDQFKQHVYKRSAEAFAAGSLARDAVMTKEQLDARKESIRTAFLEAVGGLPASSHPLSPVTTGTCRFEELRIDNIIIESRPHTFVTSNLYIPEGLTEPSAAVLFVCGHFEEGRLAAEYRSVCLTLARSGLIVFAIDPIGQGERSSYYEKSTGQLKIRRGTSDHEQAGAQCWALGDGLARYFLHDITRAIDYMCTRPEIDPERIGITGNSGGGLQTSMAMLCEHRIAAAAPATFITSREAYILAGSAQDAEQIWPGMSKAGFDHEDILLAMAPKPVLVLAAKYDFFPIEGTRHTVARSKRYWSMFGKESSLSLFEDTCEHHYSPAMANAAAAFFVEQLLGNASGKAVAEQRNETRFIADLSLKLECTRSGHVLGDFADARTPWNENVDRLLCIEMHRAEMDEAVRRKRAMEWLDAQVRFGRERVDFNPRVLKVGTVDGLEVREWLWWSQAGVMNRGLLFRDQRIAEQQLPLVIAVWEKGTRALHSHMDRIHKACQAGSAILVLDVTAEGAAAAHAISPYELRERFGTHHKLTTDLFWLGDSLAAMRTFDILRALELAACMEGIDSGRVHLYGEGSYGLYARIAGLLERERCEKNRRAPSVEVERGIPSIADWVREQLYDNRREVLATIWPGMLKYCDLADLDRWLAEEDLR